jgi:rhodanese-related sulfurtransferase
MKRQNNYRDNRQWHIHFDRIFRTGHTSFHSPRGTCATLGTTMASTEGSSAVRNRRRNSNSGDNGSVSRTTKQEQLERQVQFYQERKWPQIPRMTPQELVALKEQVKEINSEHDQHQDRKVLLIDVRTAAERAVSVIPGSVPLQQVSQRGSAAIVQLLRQDTTVVMYCTIGYRSGMEATRLLHRYPTLEGRIYNLDGIVAYTYLNTNNCNATDGATGKQDAISTLDECSPLSPASVPTTTKTTTTTTTSDPQQEQNQNQNQRQHNLVDPVTNDTVWTVHTFGSMWSLADPHYTASHFPLPQLAVRLGQVGGKIVVRFMQRVAYYTVQSCYYCCGSSSSNAGAAAS